MSFDRLLEEHRPKLLAHARRTAPASYEPEDLVQDTLVRAFRCRRRYTPGRPFLSWALRIMERLVLDHLRAEGRRVNPLTESFEAEISEGVFLKDALADGECEEAICRVERRVAFQQELEALRVPLSPQQLEILRSSDDLDYSASARALGVPIGTVRSRLHRARCRIRQSLRNALVA